MRPIEDLALGADSEAEPAVVLLLNLTDRADEAYRVHPTDVVAGRMCVDRGECIGVVVIQSGMSSHMQILGGCPGLVFRRAHCRLTTHAG